MKYKPLIAFGILIGNEAAFAQTINAGDAVLTSSGTYEVSAGVTLNGTNTVSVDSGVLNANITNNGVLDSSNASLYFKDNTTGTFVNNGTVTSSGYYGFLTVGNNASVVNNGTITKTVTAPSGGAAFALQSFATRGAVTVLNNAGTISAYAVNDIALLNYGTIGSVLNTGTISSDAGTAISNNYVINTITNTGTINASSAGFYAINNNGAGTIGTLNNAQGGTTPLTYYGALPANYNIILGSNATTYGKLTVSAPTYADYGSATTTFGIHSGTVSSARYVGVISGVTTSYLGTTQTGSYGGYTWTLELESGSTTVWDLLFAGYSPTPPPPTPPSGPTAADTQEALLQSAAALRTVFNQQTAVVNNSLHYDCAVFATNGVCVSGGGRFATTSSITGDQMSTLLVASYKATKDIRIGGVIDQNVSANNVVGVSIDKRPMYGVFGVWNQNPNLMGYGVRLATSWSDQNITQTRHVVGTSEAGVGTASLKSQAISGVVSYAMPVTNSAWVASPYAGIRKTRVARGGYAETSAVTTPLTYNDLSQDVTTAMAGVRMNKKYNDDLYVMASVGLEHNIGSKISTLDVSGITGLTATDFGAYYAKARPVASVGLSYSIAKNQSISFSAMYRKEAFQSSGSTTGLLMYQVGL